MGPADPSVLSAHDLGPLAGLACGSPHTADDSRALAAGLQIQLRFLPVATPELNAMDHLWRHVKRDVLSNRPTCSIDTSADVACQYLLDLSPQQRLKKAGALSGNFWLA